MALEYIPFDAYGLLRRIADRGPQRIRRDQIELDETAKYLVSRGLAAANATGSQIENTAAARSVGLVDYTPPA